MKEIRAEMKKLDEDKQGLNKPLTPEEKVAKVRAAMRKVVKGGTAKRAFGEVLEYTTGKKVAEKSQQEKWDSAV